MLLELLAGSAPTLGEGRLLLIDGPGGSGKTTLAAAVSSVTGAPVIHMDDLYDGWEGLETVGEQLGTILTPLTRGEIGRYRRFDWHAGCYAETVAVPPTPLLVVEGVGSGAAAYAGLAGLLVWVDTPSDLRLARGLARDGEAVRPQWLAWRAAEERHFAREQTRERADVLLDGTGISPPVVRASARVEPT